MLNLDLRQRSELSARTTLLKMWLKQWKSTMDKWVRQHREERNGKSPQASPMTDIATKNQRTGAPYQTLPCPKETVALAATVNVSTGKVMVRQV